MLNSLFKWTPQRAAKWSTIRQRGKWHYIFWRWVVFWGLSMVVLNTLSQARRNQWAYVQQAIGFLPINIPLHLLGGLLAGLIVWRWTEHSYLLYLSETEHELLLE